MRLRDDRLVALRNARSEDIPAVQQFVRDLSDQSRRRRFFAPLRELTADQLDRVTRTRDPRELALVAETVDDAQARIVAMAQYVLCEPDDAEFAVVVHDAFQRQGLGTELIGALAEHAARQGLTALAAFVLADNWPMLTLLASLGCELASDDHERVIRAVRRLDTEAVPA